MPKEPDYSDLVAVVDIADRFTEINGKLVSPANVSMWLNRFGQLADAKRSIPLPESRVGGRRLYSWRKFSAWGRRNNLLKPEKGRIYDDRGFDVTERYVAPERKTQ